MKKFTKAYVNFWNRTSFLTKYAVYGTTHFIILRDKRFVYQYYLKILSRVRGYAWRKLWFYIGWLDLLALRLQSLLIKMNTTRTYKQYSAIANLHTFQFTTAHALAFSVFTTRRNSSQQCLCVYNIFNIRFLATDLKTVSLWLILLITH
jgi:hypothetical protein